MFEHPWHKLSSFTLGDLVTSICTEIVTVLNDDDNNDDDNDYEENDDNDSDDDDRDSDGNDNDDDDRDSDGNDSDDDDNNGDDDDNDDDDDDDDSDGDDDYNNSDCNDDHYDSYDDDNDECLENDGDDNVDDDGDGGVMIRSAVDPEININYLEADKLPHLESLTLYRMINSPQELRCLGQKIATWKLKILDISGSRHISGKLAILLRHSFAFLSSLVLQNC